MQPSSPATPAKDPVAGGQPASSPPSQAARSATASPFVYPSVDPGFPALDLEQLLSAHSELLARIKVCYGTDRETFERDVLTLVRRYAAYVHLLPATPSNYFNEPGGLLRLGLETAFFALQGTDAHIFSGRATISVRRQLEPRWRLATFIAGLCAEIHRTVGQVIVTDHEGDEWRPYLQGLHAWLADRQLPRYYLKWLPNAPESPGLALFALPLIVPAETLQHLATGNSVIVPHMLASLSCMPLYRDHNILGDLVRRAAALVIDQFQQASADRYGKPQLGSHLERYLVDALRRLVATNPAWMPNAERSRVWYGCDGLFIVWPNAAMDIRKLLEADQLPGIPKSPETMLEILQGAGVFEQQASLQPLWTITPPGSKAALEAVKLTQPEIVLAGIEPRPTPLQDPLAAAAPPPKAGPSPASPQPSVPPSQPPAPPPEAPLEMDRPAPPESGAHAPTTGPLASEPHQLELPVSGMDTPDSGPGTSDLAAEGPGAEPTSSRPPASPCLSVDAPMRLAPRVRTALIEIVQALNGQGERPMANATPDGLVIALSEFERRHIEPTAALRALADARMLAADAQASSPASNCQIGTQTCLALTIAPKFLSGLPAVASNASVEP